MGCPIKGDLKYGSPRSNPDGSICLHARRVRFVHPVSKELIELKAPLPEGIYGKDLNCFNQYKSFFSLEMYPLGGGCIVGAERSVSDANIGFISLQMN